MLVEDPSTGKVRTTSRSAYISSVLSAVESRVAEVVDAYETQGTAAPDPVAFAATLNDVLAAPELVENPIAAAVGPFWSSAAVRDRLGIPTRQALDSRISNGSILAVRTADRRLLFPISQFVRDGDRIIVRAGLRRMFSILRREDPWAVGLLLTTPAPELDDLTPLQWERDGRNGDELEQLARHVRAEWSS